MKKLVIYNPWAGHGYGEKIRPDIEHYMRSLGMEFDLLKTAAPGHGRQLVAEADLEQYDGIIAGGGDGTLFEVINGVYANPRGLELPLGVLPVGTGNAFVRDMDLHHHDWKPALDIIAQGKTRACDVGKFSTQGKTYYYLNILGLGLVADIGATAARLKIFGNASYTLGTFYHLMRLKPFNVEIELDGNSISRENIFIEISNTRYTANFLMAPHAKTDDGKLDVTLLGPKGRIGLMRSFPKILTGDHIHMPEVETFQASRIKIRSDIPKVLTPDGELMGSTPVDIECLSQAVKVYWK